MRFAEHLPGVFKCVSHLKTRFLKKTLKRPWLFSYNEVLSFCASPEISLNNQLAMVALLF